MIRNQIAQTVAQFIRETFLFDGKAELDLQRSLIGSGIVDSTEREFNIAFDDRELVINNFESVDRIASFVAGKLAAKGDGGGRASHVSVSEVT